MVKFGHNGRSMVPGLNRIRDPNRGQLLLPGLWVPHRFTEEYTTRSSDGAGRQWVVGPHCYDLAWPWWHPNDWPDVWPDGNRPRILRST